MPTAQTTQLCEFAEAFQNAVSSAMQAQTVEAFDTLERQLAELSHVAREAQQNMWMSGAKQTLANLQKGHPLTPTDQDVIRTFLVSDAANYVQMENNFQDWNRELERLTDDIVSRANTADRDSIGEFRGVLADATQLLPNIRNYLSARQRLQRFDLATGQLDKPTRDALVKILREQIHSDNR